MSILDGDFVIPWLSHVIGLLPRYELYVAFTLLQYGECVHVNQNKCPMCETDVTTPIKQHSWIASLSAMYDTYLARAFCV